MVITRPFFELNSEYCEELYNDFKNALEKLGLQP